MKVVVRSMTGQNLEVNDVDGSQDVAHLKTCIEEQHSFPAQFQRLILSGKELDSASALEAVGVVEGIIVLLAIRPQETAEVAVGAAEQCQEAPSSEPDQRPSVDQAISIAIDSSIDQQVLAESERARLHFLARRYSKTVRIGACFHFVFGMLLATQNPWLFVIMLLSAYGFVGARTYRSDWVLIYLLFVGIFTTKILAEVIGTIAAKKDGSDLFVFFFLIFQVSHILRHCFTEKVSDDILRWQVLILVRGFQFVRLCRRMPWQELVALRGR